MFKKITTLVIVCFFSFSLVAHNKDEIKKTTKIIQRVYAKIEKEKIHDALQLLINSDTSQKFSPEFNYLHGALLVATHHEHKALKYLTLANDSGFKSAELNFLLAKAIQADNEPEKAMPLFISTKETYKRSDFEKSHLMHSMFRSYNSFISSINEEIEYCKNGIELMKTPVEVTIKNLGAAINSHYPDYVPAISVDESVLIFTSCRPSTKGGKRDRGGNHNNHYFEDIYVSEKNKDGTWSDPKGVGNLINSSSHDACVGLSADGQKMFIYKDVKSHKLAGGLFYSELKGTKWSKPIPFNNEINSTDYEPSCSMSADERLLFFTSNRPGGYGGLDIYVAHKQENGDYANVKNLGPAINTAHDEDSPFIHADGKTLYFSSKGHKSIGGFDIFKSTVNEKTGENISQPVNLGYPLNTAEDDIYFVWSADGKRAYFSSERETGFGEKDLYMMEIKQEESHVVILRGTFLEKGTNKPLYASVSVIDSVTNEFIGNHHSNSKTGKFTIVLPAGKNYKIVAEDEHGHIIHTWSKNIPPFQKYSEIIDAIYIDPEILKSKIHTTKKGTH